LIRFGPFLTAPPPVHEPQPEDSWCALLWSPLRPQSPAGPCNSAMAAPLQLTPRRWPPAAPSDGRVWSGRPLGV